MKKFFKTLKWEAIFTGICAIIVGLAFIITPSQSALMLCYLAGVILVVTGLVNIMTFLTSHTYFNDAPFFRGSIALLIGVLCICQPYFIQGILSVLLGLFIVVDGMVSLNDCIVCHRAKVSGWIPLLILSLCTIGFGSVVLFGRFDSVLLFAGYVLLFDGVADVIIACRFSRRIRKAKEALQLRYQMSHVDYEMDYEDNEDSSDEP